MQQALHDLLAKNLPVGMGFNNQQPNNMLAKYIRSFYNMLKRYGLRPGIDMLSAILAGKRINAKLCYGDRNSEDTFREITLALRSSPKALIKGMTTPLPEELQRIFAQVHSEGLENLGDNVERIKTREYAKVMTDWIDQVFPEVAEALIHRRDAIMVDNLKRNCTAGGKVVAVVGMAHMDGIEREWNSWKNKKR